MQKFFSRFLLIGILFIALQSFNPASATFSMSPDSPRGTITPIGTPALPLPDMQVKALAAVSKEDVWIAGSSTNNNDKAQVFYQHYSNRTWSVVPSPSIGDSSVIKSLATSSVNDIWAAGSYHDQDGSHALIEHWDGQYWSFVPLRSPDDFDHDSQLNAITAISPTNIWTVGSYYTNDPYHNRRALTEQFNGLQWTVVSADNPYFVNRDILSIHAISATDVWATGKLSFGSPFAEHFDGSQWTYIHIPNINGGNGYATTLSSLSAIQPNDIWAVGNFAKDDDMGAVSEHWDGNEWFYVSLNNLPGRNQSLSSVIALQTNNVWAMGTLIQKNAIRPLVVRWNGTYWENILLPQSLTALTNWQRLDKTNTLLGVGTYNQQLRLLTFQAA